MLRKGSSVQFSSVAQSCPTLCDPMNRSMPGLPAQHQLWSLPKLMFTESVMPSNHLILCRPLLLLPSIFPSIRVFSRENGTSRVVTYCLASISSFEVCLFVLVALGLHGCAWAFPCCGARALGTQAPVGVEQGSVAGGQVESSKTRDGSRIPWVAR